MIAVFALRFMAVIAFIVGGWLITTAADRGDSQWAGPVLAAAVGIALLVAAAIVDRVGFERYKEEQQRLIPVTVKRLRQTVEAIGYYESLSAGDDNGTRSRVAQDRSRRCVMMFLESGTPGSNQAVLIERLIPKIHAEGSVTREPIALHTALETSLFSRLSYVSGGTVLPLAEFGTHRMSMETGLLKEAFPDWYEQKFAWLQGQRVDAGLIMRDVLELLLHLAHAVDEVVAPA